MTNITLFMCLSDPYSTCITGRNCYKVMVEVGQVTKVTAEDKCKKYGGHLVSMETQQEYTDVLSWLTQFGTYIKTIILLWLSMTLC